MQKQNAYLCSDLIELTFGGTVLVGNLEQICEGGCSVTLEEPVDVGAEVRMHCIACPIGNAQCTECQFKGQVSCADDDPTLGCALEIEFAGRKWSSRDWQPRHLINVSPVDDSAEPLQLLRAPKVMSVAQGQR
jgi:hypothetical protein